MDMRITAKNKFRTLVILLLILAVTVSAALWSVLRTRDGTREAYADTLAADIVGAINNAEPWGSVSSVTVGNGAGDNGVVVTIGESDAVDENGIVLKEIVLKTGAQAVVGETLPSAQHELEGKEVYSLVVFDVPVTVQSEAKLTLNADVVFRAGVTVYGTLEINGMAFNQKGKGTHENNGVMTVSNTLNNYSEIKSEGVIVNGSLNNDGERNGKITVSDGSALTVNAGGALFLKAAADNALGVSGTITNKGSVIYQRAATVNFLLGENSKTAIPATFISSLSLSGDDDGRYVFYPEKPDTGEGTALPVDDGTAFTLLNDGTRNWSGVTLLSFGRTTLKNSEDNVYYTFTNVNLGGITNVNSDGSVSEKFTQGANELIFDGGAKWTQGKGDKDNYDLYFLVGSDSDTRAEYYNSDLYSDSDSDPFVTVSDELNMYGGVKITHHETRAGTGVGGGVYVPSGATLNMYGGEISYNAVTQISSEQNIGGAGVYCAGTLKMDGGKITRNANASVGYRSASAAGVAVNGNGSSLVLNGGEISFNCGATGDASTNHLGADGGGVQGNTKAKITMNGGSISNNWTGGYGGGVALWDAEFTMKGGEISGNEAAWGGGVNANGASGEPSKVYITNGTISGNRAEAHLFNGNTLQGGYGGGLCVGSGTQQTNSSAEISGGVISGNTAVYGGGLAVYTINSYGYNTLTMSGGTVTGNSVKSGDAENGNGVYVYCVSNTFAQSEGMLRLSGNASIDTSNNVSFNFNFGTIPIYIYSSGTTLYYCEHNGIWGEHAEQENFFYNNALYIKEGSAGPDNEYYDDIINGTLTATGYDELRRSAREAEPVASSDRHLWYTGSHTAFNVNDAIETYSISGIYEAVRSNSLNINAPITVDTSLKGTQLASLVYLGNDGVTSLWQGKDIISYSNSATVNRNKFLLDSDTYTFKVPENTRVLQIAAAEGNENSVAYNANKTPPYYSSLADAVAAAESGDTIQILRSATLDKTIVIDKNITIVPNGDFTLYIKSGFDTSGAINPALFRVENGATLTLGGQNTLTVSGNTSEENIPLVTVINGSYVQKSGVTLTGASVNDDAEIHNVQTDASAIYLASSNASATIEGGVIRSNKGGLGAIYVGDGASLTLSGGAIGGTLDTDYNIDTDHNVDKNRLEYGVYVTGRGKVSLNGSVALYDAINLSAKGASVTVGAGYVNALPETLTETLTENDTIRLTYADSFDADDVVVNILNTYKGDAGTVFSDFALYEMDESLYALRLRGSSDGDSKNALVVQKAVRYIFDFRYQNGYSDDTLVSGMGYSGGSMKNAIESLIQSLNGTVFANDGRIMSRGKTLVVYVFSGSESFSLGNLKTFAQKEGWTLSAWHRGSADSVLSAIGDSASLAYTNSSAPIELRSVWTPNQFNITFDYNYTGLGDGAQPSLIEGTMESQIVDYSDLETSNQEARLTVNNYTAVGFLFAGWSLTRGTDASTQFTDKQKLSADDWDTMIGGVIGVEHEATETEAGYVEYSITLYAVWENLFSGGVGTSANPFKIGKIEDLYILEATTMGTHGSSDSGVSVPNEYYNTHSEDGAAVAYAAENYEGYYFLLTADLTGFKGVIGRTSSKDVSAATQDEEITESMLDAEISASLPNDVQNSENKNGITDNGTPFAGTFDGDGKSIGLAINKQQVTETQYEEAKKAAEAAGGTLAWVNGDETLLGAGLFGYTVGATISNLTLTGSVHGYSHVGGLVGYAVNTAISSIYNEAAVSSGGHDVGGIVGTYFVTNESGTQYVITNVVNTGAISYAPRLDDKTTTLSTQPGWSETDKLSDVQGIRFGGIVGYGITLRLTGGYNTGDVTGRYAVGGVVGILHSLNNNTTSDTTLTNSFNTGAVTATAGLYATVHSADGGVNAEAVNAYVGGLVGRAVGASAIDTAFNSGRVTASWTGVKNTSGEYAGKYVYVDLSVTLPSEDSEYIGARGAGGIVGFTSYNKSANEGDLKSIANVYNTGAISAWASVGGIAGYFAYSTVSRAYNGGSVLANGFHFEGGDQVAGGMKTTDGTYHAFLGSIVGMSIGSSLSDVYYNTDKRYEHFTDETLRQIGDYEYTAETLGFAESTFSSDRGRTASQMSVIAENNRPSGFGTDFSGTYWSFLYYADQTTGEAGQAEEGQAGQTYHYPQLNAFAGDGNTVTIGGRSFELGTYSKDSTLVTVPANGGENDKPITDTDSVTISYSLGGGAFTFAGGSAENGYYFAEDGYRYTQADELWQTEVEYKIGGGEAHEELAQLERPGDPARVGYRFTGWYSDAACREPFSFGSIPASDKTVYAGWEAVTYTFVYEEFSSRGASFVGEHDATFSILDEGKDVDLPTADDVTRRGYTLSGWLYNNKAVDSYRVIAPSSGTPYIEFYSGGTAVETVPFNAIVNQQLYLTAVWKAISYTITYGGLTADKFVDGEAATLNGAKDSYTITDSFTFAKPQKKGYTFDGWKLVSLDGKTATEDLDSINKEHYVIGDILTGIVSGTVGDIVLEAQWTRNNVTLYLDARGGEIEDFKTHGLERDLSGRYYISVPYYSNGSNALAFLFGAGGTFHVTATLPEGSGRTFNGWYTVVNPSEGDAAITKYFTVKGDAAGTGSQTIYAGYETSKYTITISLGDHADPDEPVNPAMEDALIAAGFDWGKGNNLATAKEFTLAGVLHGSSASEALELLASAIKVTSGWNFLGWVVTGSSSSDLAPIYNVTSDLEITAKYDEEQVAVNFVGLNGELLGSVTIGQGSVIGENNEAYTDIAAKADSYFGYDFKGWYYTDASGVRQDFKITDAVSASMVVYADLQAKKITPQFVLTIDGAQQEVPLDGYTYDFGAAFGQFPTLSDLLDQLSDEVAKKYLGYQISRWSVNGSAVNTNTVITQEMVEGSESLTIELRAELTKATYTINFNANGGSFSGVAPVGTYQFGNADSVQYHAGSGKWKDGLPVPQRAGHDLAWNVYDANGSRLGDGTVTDAAGLIKLLNDEGYAGDLSLIAAWTAEVYTVWFSANGGTFTVPEGGIVGIKFYAADKTEVTEANHTAVYFTMEVQYGTVPNPPVALDAPQQIGYIFLGWRTSQNMILTEVTSEGQYSQKSPIQAYWTEGKYSITFVTNGGTPISDITDISYGADLSEQLEGKTTERDGYTFAGWYYSSDFNDENKVQVGDTMPSKDLVLYAKWKVNSYKLTLNITFKDGTVEESVVKEAFEALRFNASVAPAANGYTVEITVPYETNLSALNTIKFGENGEYSLSGTWTHDADGNVLLTFMPASDYEVSGTFTTPEKPSESVTVTFYLVDGTEYYKTTVSSGTVIGKLPAPTRTGYKFIEWRTAEGKAFSLDTPIKADTNLYAHWEAVEYKVTLRGEGVNLDPIKVAYGTTLTWSDGGLLPVPARGGYTFEGWYLDADFSTTAEGTDMPAYGITLYAKWKATEYSIVFKWGLKGENSITISDGYNSALNLSSVGGDVPHYTFIWQVTAVGKEPIDVTLDDFRTMPNLSAEYAGYTSDADGRVAITVQAAYTAIGYEITLEGAAPVTVTVADASEEEKTEFKKLDDDKTGYTFAGWKLSSSDTAYNYYMYYMVDENRGEWGVYLYSDADSADGYFVPFTEGFSLYLTAAYTAMHVSVTLDSQGGSGAEVDFGGDYDSVLTGLPVPTKPGYTFDGWYVGDKKWEDDVLTTENGVEEQNGVFTLALTAHWTAIKYKIIYNLNGGSENPNPTTYTIEQTVQLNKPTDAPTGYTFLYWMNAATGKRVDEITAGSMGDITLIAQYKPNTYGVSVSGSGISADVQSVLHGQENVVIRLSVTEEGYHLLDPVTVTMSGTQSVDFTYDNGVITIQSSVTGEITITASAQQNTYTVTFDANGGTGGGVKEDIAHGSTLGTIAPDEPKRDGYQFIGWNTDRNASSALNDDYAITGEVTLYAVWEANAYTVTFDKNGGEGTMDGMTFTYGTAQNLSANAFTRAGYTFAGWARKAGATEIEFADGASVINLTAADGGKVTLYAVWRANTYTVTFDPNYEGGAESDKEVIYDSVYGILPVPTRVGYTFDGWYLNDELVNAATQVTTADNHTLTAHWTAIEYTIVYNGLRGTKHSNPTSYTIESNEIVLQAPTSVPTGYTFDGWYNGEDKVTAIPAGSYGNLTLTARWKANSYTVTFDKNGGEGTMDGMTFTYGVAQNLSANAFTRTGYTFAGWATDPKGTEVKYANGASVINLTAENGATVTLYAVWRADSYTIVFVGGEFAMGAMNNQTVLYNGSITLTENRFVRLGYDFLGWAYTSGAGVSIKNEGSIKIDENFEGVIEGTTIKLHAVWSQIEYKLKLDATDGHFVDEKSSSVTGTYGGYFVLPDAKAFKALEGYTFLGWSKSEIGEDILYNGGASVPVKLFTDGVAAEENVGMLYAVWTKNSYTVMFNANGGTGNMGDMTFTYGTAQNLSANTFTRTGYTFDGWATDPKTTEKVYEDGESVSNLSKENGGRVTLYAVWKANTYTIAYEGGVEIEPEKDAAFGSAITLKDPTRPGFIFLGWYIGDDEGTRYRGSVSVGMLASAAGVEDQNGETITLIAKWQAAEGALTVTIVHADGSRQTIGVTSGKHLSKAEINVPKGYDYDEATYRIGSAQGAVFDFGQKITADMTLHVAGGKLITYTITLDYEDGETTDTLIKVEHGQPLDSADGWEETPVRIGYEFGGWYNGETRMTGGSIVTGALTLTAQWNAIDYTVTFNPNHESGTSTKATYQYDKVVVLIDNPERDGYTFEGWYYNGELWTPGTTMPAENITLVAMWTLQSFTVSFSVGDGATGVADQKIYFEFTATKPTDPVRSGYIFGGWMLNESEYDFGTSVEGNITLTAKWLPRTYSIDYVLGGGVNASSNPDSYNIESGTIVLADPTREGFIFLGWYDAEQNGNRVTEIKAGSTGRITLYARWQANTYTVDFVLNGGTMKSTEQIVVAGGTVAFEEPTRENYLFMGWFTDAACTQRYDFSTPVTGDLTLYAKWRLSVISGTASDGTIVTITSDDGFDDGTTIRFTEVTDETTLSEAAGSLAENMTLARLFDIELIAADGTPVSIDKPLSVGISVQGLADAVGRYAVVYVPDGGGTIEEIATHIGEDGRMYFFVEHFSFYAVVDVLDIAPTGGFAWWWILVAVAGCAALAGIIVLLARSMRRYELNYVNGGVPSQKLKESALVDLPLPEREEEVFDGWYYDEMFRDRATLTSMPKQNLILFAKWRKMTEEERAARDRARAEAAAAAAEGFHEAKPKKEKKHKENPLNEIKEDE